MQEEGQGYLAFVSNEGSGQVGTNTPFSAWSRPVELFR